MPSFFNLDKDQALKELNSSLKGLDEQTVSSLQQKHGKNALKAAKRKTRFSILLSQFKDVMILILVIAAVISFAVGETTDAFVILAIIIANAWMGYSQEYDAERSIQMLQKMTTQNTLVIRNGKSAKIDTTELVPGDIISLQAGDMVPADARLLEVNSLKTEEASLTGESHAIEKTIDPIKDDKPVPGDQLNMIFKGTLVSNGSAKAVVTATGMNTELGKIAGMMETESQKTPLQKRLTRFSKQLAIVVLIICILVFGFGWWRGEPPFEMFLTALSLAVAALPEALPAVITIALARGARRMVKQKALMRKLPAVETLGSVTYICTDKTGTLTQNVMTVEKVESVADDKNELLTYSMFLNNEVRFGDDGLLGDSTETALVKHAMDKGIKRDEAKKRFPLVKKIPFDSDRMRMSTLHKDNDKWILFVKGAPAKIIDALSGGNNDQKEKWLEVNREWAAQGWRVLFFAYKIFDKDPGEVTGEAENELDFLGMVAMIDPPREEVIKAIEECTSAGIETVMITGDQALTAKAIAERLKIIEKDDEVKTGSDIQKMSDEDFERQVKNISVYARVSPKQKLNIVKALQKKGEFVAMTGDGVNDAPSLKQADIGVAMGITGTDVSKEAADMVLLDDNFATIVKAVREGRRIYENIRKFILYVLSCNFGEILTIFTAPLVGLPMPLLPIHILWINLVTDGLPGLALVAEPAEKDIMMRPPRPPKESLFAGGLVGRIIMTAALMAMAAIFIQWQTMERGYDQRVQQSAVFTVLCFVQLANALSVRSMYHTMFSSAIFKNAGMWLAIVSTIILQLVLIYAPFAHNIFKTAPLPVDVMSSILATIAVFIVAVELLKWVSKKILQRHK